jgi:uncharacterized protein YecE (DUF72 family)
MTIRVGTSGWVYKDWRGDFYPSEVPQRRWLEHYTTVFDTVELNNAFYRLPSFEDFEGWRDRVPDGFVVAVKASRFLTHIKRLAEPAEPVERLMKAAAGLGDRLGPILLQLPPNLQVDIDRLDACLAEFPSGIRVAVEPRHASWWTDDVRRLLEKYGAALAWADRKSRPLTPLWRTTDWGYLRLHEGGASPWPSYGKTALKSWARRMTDAWDDGYVYFNNDQHSTAPRNAETFRRFL